VKSQQEQVETRFLPLQLQKQIIVRNTPIDSTGNLVVFLQNINDLANLQFQSSKTVATKGIKLLTY